MHSTASDGTDTPDQILDKVRRSGLMMFSLTDHDAVKGCLDIAGRLTDGDPEFITGAEFSCRDEMGRYHILGYRIDAESSPVRKVLETGHGYRMTKLRERLDYLKMRYGFSFSDEDTRQLYARNNPGKPHIARLMVKYGFSESVDAAFRDYLNQIESHSGYLRPEQAIEGILAGGGIPVLAHPAFGSGNQRIYGDELEKRVVRLMGFGLRGLEAFYSGFGADITAGLIGLSERYRLYVTAGSDYHGTSKTVALGDTGCLASSEVPDGMKRFLCDVLDC